MKEGMIEMMSDYGCNNFAKDLYNTTFSYPYDY